MSITYTFGTEGGGVSSPESESLSSKSAKREKFALIESNSKASNKKRSTERRKRETEKVTAKKNMPTLRFILC